MITPGAFDSSEAEKRTITAISDTSTEPVITLDSALTFDHAG